MAEEQLPPDPEALEKWSQMPQNLPSPSALPPATGGTRWTWWFLGVLGTLLFVALIVQLLSS